MEYQQLKIRDANYSVGRAGNGPAVLLLHGFPQTHYCWRLIVPELTDEYTVIAPDLRGYGASSAPVGGPDGQGFTKREMAGDQVDLMEALGIERFTVVGHDRGARVAYRMALDHPGQRGTPRDLERHSHGRSVRTHGRRSITRLLAVVSACPTCSIPGTVDRRRSRARPSIHLRHLDGDGRGDRRRGVRCVPPRFVPNNHRIDLRRLPRKLLARSPTRHRRPQCQPTYQLSPAPRHRCGRGPTRGRTRDLAKLVYKSPCRNCSRRTLHPRGSARGSSACPARVLRWPS